MSKRLFSRDFSLMVLGQIVSVLGSAVLRFALNLYVLDVTGRADIFGLLIAVSAIPAIMFTPLGGAIADRFSRRNLMVIFDFSSGAVVLVLIFLLSTGNAPIAVIGVILAVLSVISSMYQPTVQASVPVLVVEEQLASGNGVVTGVGALSGLLGPVLGGVLYGIVGLNALVAASCVMFFLSAVMEIFIRIPFVKQAREKKLVPTIIDDMKLGLRYVVREKPAIRKIIILAAGLNMLLTPFFIVGIPYILRITLDSSENMYGIGMGLMQFSTILGAVLTGVITKKLVLSDLYKVLLVIAAVMLPMAFAVTPLVLGAGYWPSFGILMGFNAVVMVLITAINIFAITSVQKVTPNEMLGKVMAIIMAVAQCAAPLGMAMYGIAFEQFSGLVYVPVLGACLFTVAISFVSKKLLTESEM
ncbi:MAG: MFS transporter [Oscillospiraceae bacterium]|nr:MFS transporter [Oscillospiraceae bacterium]